MIDYGYGVSLRAVCQDDMPEMRSWRNDESIWKWCRQNDLISDAMQTRWFSEQDSDATTHMYVIQHDGEAVGICGLTSHDRNNRIAELSLYIAPDQQRRGFSSPSFKTLMNHGFKNLNLHSIWCECFTGNPVIAVVKKVGFTPDGIKREAYFKGGSYVNAELFSILEDEWTE